MTRDRAVDRDVSQAIRLARILSIFFTAYVHAWPGASLLHEYSVLADTEWIMAIFVDFLGRGAVPLLSAISGMLAYLTLGRRATLPFLAGKLRTLIIPMIIWNAVFMAILVASSTAGLQVWVPQEGWPTWLLALDDQPVNRPLGFLRDAFVCALFAVILCPALDRRPALGLALTGAMTVVAMLTPSLLFLRPQIFALFALGLVLMRFDLVRSYSRASVGFAALSALALLDMYLASVTPQPQSGQDLIELFRRFLIATLFWQACMILVRLPGTKGVLGLERYIFFFFCSHIIVFRFFGVPAEMVLTNAEDFAFWMFFLLQPFLGFVLVVLIYEAGMRTIPRFMYVATGGRAPKGKALPALKQDV